jgi:molybdate transport system substrate-binding protein
MVRSRWRTLGAASVAGALLACDAGDDARAAIVVAAAADLAAAMPALAAAFEAETGTRVVATLGSSGQLAQQIAHGAPVDVFASADAGWVDFLDAAGRTVTDTRALYARGRLVLRAGRGRPDVARIEDLAHESIRRIAIANPEHAPYGRAAREALQRAGIASAVEPKLVIAENVRIASQYAQTGNVDVAITALSLVGEHDAGWSLVPAALHSPLDQVIVAVAGRPREAEARAFVRFVLGPRGREILARWRFELPDGEDGP